MNQINLQKNTNAWIAQVWASFIISASLASISVIYLPVDNYVKGFTGVSFLFALSSSFTLAKTLRDNQEAHRLTARIDEARVEKILSDHHPLK